MKRLIFIVLIGLFFKSATISGQLNVQQKNSIIDTLCKKVEQYYIYPEVADSIVSYLKKQQKNDAYINICDAGLFASEITKDLRKAGKDQHLRLEYSESVLAEQGDDAYVMSEEEQREIEQYVVHENYGIAKIEVLKGNIGFIDFNWICGADYAGEKYASMMDYLSHTDALIIDLRKCRGAMGRDAINYLASYFFDESIHLNDLIWRKNNFTEQKWTYAYVPGKRYIEKPVYVLTSARTFSGGEGFCYHLQALKRITVIGEQTRGGANPGGSVRISDHFSSFIPFGRTYNPITKTSWEGIGVVPDSLVKANRALFEAHKIALQYCINKTNDTGWKTSLQGFLRQLENNPPRFKKALFELKGYKNAKKVFVTGSFNNWAAKTNPMVRKGNSWVTEVECESGPLQYRFIVDEIPILDPENKATIKEGEYTNSIRMIE